MYGNNVHSQVIPGERQTRQPPCHQETAFLQQSLQQLQQPQKLNAQAHLHVIRVSACCTSGGQLPGSCLCCPRPVQVARERQHAQDEQVVVDVPPQHPALAVKVGEERAACIMQGRSTSFSKSTWGLALQEFGLVADEAMVIYSLSSAQGVMPCVVVNPGRFSAVTAVGWIK